MIRKLEVEDIAKIIVLDDNIKDRLPCTKGEWIQFLVSQVNNPKMKIVGNVSDAGELKAYAVFMDSVVPPVFDAVVVLFIWSPDRHRTTSELIETGKQWAVEIGAKRGICALPLSHDDKYAAAFGGVHTANLYEWKIDGAISE